MSSRVMAISLLTIFNIIYSHTGWTQTIWYVTETGAGSSDGTSWTNATNELQEAIDSAKAGDQIWIAAGTYYPTVGYDADDVGGIEEREKTFYINKNLKIFGGFVGTETDLSQRSNAHVVILSGDIDMVPEQEDYSENSYHVVFIDGSTNPIDTTCHLEGLTIQLGRAFNPVNYSATEIHEKGAGVYLNGSNGGVCSPSFVSCTFNNNSTSFFNGYGGHMCNNGEGGNCSPVIEDCIFSDGYARFGGAIYLRNSLGQNTSVIRSCQFMNNASTDGGGIYNYAEGGIGSLLVTNCEFIGNSALGGKTQNGYGGGISHHGNSSAEAPIIMHSIFRDNNAAFYGGGIYTSGTAIIANCQFINNEGDGGGIANFGLFNNNNHTLILNSSFAGNNQSFPEKPGGSLYNFGNSSNPNIVNSVLWGNYGNEVYNTEGASAKFTSCIVQGSGGSTAWVDSFGIDSGNNLDLDPMYVGANDLQLMSGSLGINAGVNDSIPMEFMTDYNGNPRIVDGTVDMGAFEYQNCHNDLILDETDSPLIGSYFAAGTMTIEGASDILISGQVELRAPNVLINSTFSVINMQQLDINIDGCP